MSNCIQNKIGTLDGIDEAYATKFLKYYHHNKN